MGEEAIPSKSATIRKAASCHINDRDISQIRGPFYQRIEIFHRLKHSCVWLTRAKEEIEKRGYAGKGLFDDEKTITYNTVVDTIVDESKVVDFVEAFDL